MQQNEVNPNAYSDWDLTLPLSGRAEIMVDATKNMVETDKKMKTQIRPEKCSKDWKA